MPPISHLVTANDFSTPVRLETNKMDAPHILLMVTPASKRPIDDIRPALPETDTIKINTAAEPAQAATLTPEIPAMEVQPKKIAITAPKDAPPDIPRVYGLASGLRSSA